MRKQNTENLLNVRQKGNVFRTFKFLGLMLVFVGPHLINLGTPVAQWLRCCATNRKVAGSIPAGVIGIFH